MIFLPLLFNYFFFGLSVINIKRYRKQESDQQAAAIIHINLVMTSKYVVFLID